MLFAVKRRPGPAITAALGIVTVSVVVRGAVGLSWGFNPSLAVLRDGLVGCLGLLVIDGLGHLVLSTVIGDPYRRRFRAFARYFEGQSAVAIGTGGLLAAGEELLFRGVLLSLLLRWQEPVAPIGAIALTAVVFGGFHLTPGSLPAVFAVWAVWEGVLLGVLFVATGSVLVVALAHALHDVVGFYALRRQRTHDGPTVGGHRGD